MNHGKRWCVQKVPIYNVFNLIEVTAKNNEANSQKILCIHVNIKCLKGTYYFATQGHSKRQSGTFQYLFQITISIPRILIYSVHIILWSSLWLVGESYFDSSI